MPTLHETAAVSYPSVGAAKERSATASVALRGLLDSGAAGKVLGTFPSAVYATLSGRGREATVVAVVTRDAVRMPNALVIAAPSTELPFAPHAAGDAVWTGDNCLHIGPVTYRAARSWIPRRIAVPIEPARLARVLQELERLLDVQPLRLDAPVANATIRLQDALIALDAQAMEDAADGLLGLGRGLTPAGDDVLAGVLVAFDQLAGLPGTQVATRQAARLGRHVADRAITKTTLLSAALLAYARRGEAADPVMAVTEALAGIREPAPALRELLSVGHSSGHDTARGLFAGTHALMAHGSLGQQTIGGNCRL